MKRLLTPDDYNKTKEYPEYNYVEDLNYREDDSKFSNPSINDFLAGYNAEPYAFQQWASKHPENKTAAKEVTVMQFNPQFLAEYILTWWNGLDGSLQDFFEGFTDRYNNALKIDVAKEIAKHGYTVIPVLTDDRAFYAKRLRNILRVARTKDLDTQLSIMKQSFKHDEAMNLCLGEVSDIKEMGTEVSEDDFKGLVDYYSQIFPEDYAIALTRSMLDNKVPEIPIEHYQDFGISDDGLRNMEKMLRETRTPYDAPYDGGVEGWNYVTDMRNFDGVRPEQYETGINAKKKD